MKEIRELEEMIYHNQSAYDIYDDMLIKIIPLAIRIELNITKEKYESCHRLTKVMNLYVDECIIDLMKLLNISNDKKLRELMTRTINEIRNNIKNEEQSL